MRAGRFNTPVSFHKRQETPNGAGGYSSEWVEQFRRMSHLVLKPLAASDQGDSGGQIRNQPDYECTVRIDHQTPNIEIGWRVISPGGWTLTVMSIGLPDPRAGTVKMHLQVGQPG